MYQRMLHYTFHLVVAVPVQFCKGWQSVTEGQKRKREREKGERERERERRERDEMREIDG